MIWGVYIAINKLLAPNGRRTFKATREPAVAIVGGTNADMELTDNDRAMDMRVRPIIVVDLWR